jgi:hypothetical protein
MNYKLELNGLDSVRDNEILSFTFRVSPKQIRSWSDTQFSVRVSVHTDNTSHTDTTHTQSYTFTVVLHGRVRRENNPFLFSDSWKTNMSARVDPCIVT